MKENKSSRQYGFEKYGRACRKEELLLTSWCSSLLAEPMQAWEPVSWEMEYN